jgi:glycosyltransferase involved in cell wall biosynthesis
VPTNSIRAEEFSTLEIKPLNNPARLLYVGRLDLKKGLVELFQAAAFLNQQGQPCVLDIVGTKEEPVFSMLTILAANLNISQHLHWHGLIPFGEALFAFYRCADVLVLPSYTEGFPHVLWEAAANGCPIVTTAVGGIPAILTHEKHCLLVAPRNASELAEGIQHLLTDADLRARIIVSAHQLAEDYSVEECARKLAMALEQR